MLLFEEILLIFSFKFWWFILLLLNIDLIKSILSEDIPLKKKTIKKNKYIIKNIKIKILPIFDLNGLIKN